MEIKTEQLKKYQWPHLDYEFEFMGANATLRIYTGTQILIDTAIFPPSVFCKGFGYHPIKISSKEASRLVCAERRNIKAIIVRKEYEPRQEAA